MVVMSEFGRKALHPVQRYWGWNELDLCRSAEASVTGTEGDIREGKARFQKPYRPKWEFGSQHYEELLKTPRSNGET